LTTRETLFAFYSLSGTSLGTIRPLAEPFLRFFYHRACCPKQFDPLKKNKKTKKTKRQNKKTKKTKRQNKKQKNKKQKIWVVFQMTYFLISTSLCKGRVSIYYFQSFQKKKAKVLSVSTFLYKFTIQC